MQTARLRVVQQVAGLAGLAGEAVLEDANERGVGVLALLVALGTNHDVRELGDGVRTTEL